MKEDTGVGWGFLPNNDLVSKPEHTVCENATWLRAAPFLSGGWFALLTCREGGAACQRHACTEAKEDRIETCNR